MVLYHTQKKIICFVFKLLFPFQKVKPYYLVLDKVNSTNEEKREDIRISFEKWISLTSHEKEEFYKKQNDRIRISPYFLKEFNEVLLNICKDII